MDMYAHPSFVKDQPHALLQLRKIDNGSRRRNETVRTLKSATTKAPSKSIARAVSPPTPRARDEMRDEASSHPNTPPLIQLPQHFARTTVAPQVSPTSLPMRRESTSSESGDDRGKLDLLAFAMEQEFAKQTV